MGGKVPDSPDDIQEEFQMDTSGRHYCVTIYTEGLKIIGNASWNVDTRSSSRRASDFLHSLPLDRLTLSKPHIYDRTSGLIIDEPDFIIVNMQQINAIYAEEQANPAS